MVVVGYPGLECGLDIFEGFVCFEPVELFFVDSMRSFHLAVDLTLTWRDEFVPDIVFLAQDVQGMRLG